MERESNMAYFKRLFLFFSFLFLARARDCHVDRMIYLPGLPRERFVLSR